MAIPWYLVINQAFRKRVTAFGPSHLWRTLSAPPKVVVLSKVQGRKGCPAEDTGRVADVSAPNPNRPECC